jgi:hypothetical protein
VKDEKERRAALKGLIGFGKMCLNEIPFLCRNSIPIAVERRA